MRMQEEVQVKDTGGRRRLSQRWKQSKGENRTEMQKRSKSIEVHFAQWIGLEYKENT